MQALNNGLAEPDAEQATKLTAHILNLETKLNAAKSPGKRKGELNQKITDNESIIKQRKLAMEKNAAIIAEAKAQMEKG